MRIGVSACLLGENCRYDGENCLDRLLIERLSEFELIAFCPEMMGGLPVPRPPCEIQGGTGEDVLAGVCAVRTKEGRDFTREYTSGAFAAYTFLLAESVGLAVMKSFSPSCGRGDIRDGSFTKRNRGGDGVAASLFRLHGIKVVSEREYAPYMEVRDGRLLRL